MGFGGTNLSTISAIIAKSISKEHDIDLFMVLENIAHHGNMLLPSSSLPDKSVLSINSGYVVPSRLESSSRFCY
jgi:hypothetical protein